MSSAHESTRSSATIAVVIAFGFGAAVSFLHGQSRASQGVAPSSSTVDVTITEGTNVAVALSPDRRTMVADILGALWVLPVQGGPAKRITDERLEARQPAFAASGREVVFQGYDDDGWDIWTIALDGSGLRRLTWGPFDDREPQWSHDGNRLAFSSDRSGSYDIWILDKRTGELQQITKDPAQDFAPAWSPDDQEIAFVSNREQGGVWAVNVETGTARLVAGVKGNANAPSWTPDGKQVMYVVAGAGATSLELSGKPVVNGEDIFPFRAQWLSATEFLYTADGKIKKRALNGSASQNIEFTATVTLKRDQYTRKKRNFDSRDPKPALGILRPAVSPDGKRVAFAAIGDLWMMDIGAKPTRVTNDRFLDTDPAWSPDGSQLVFSSDRGGGGNIDLWIRDMKTGQDRRLTELPVPDVGASWSPDGKRIAFIGLLPHSQGADVYVVDVQTRSVKPIYHTNIRIPTYPTWSPDGRTVLVASINLYSGRFREGINKFVAIPSDGGDARIIEVQPHTSVVDSRIGEGPVWSPDGSRVAFVNQGLLRVVDVDATGRPLGPVRQLTNEIAYYPSWTGDSRKILYQSMDQLKMLSIADGVVQPVPLDLQYKPAQTTGHLVVHAARLWDGIAKTLKSDVDVVIEGHRIRSIEPHRTALHTGNVVNATTDQTVIPGLIDMHAHVYIDYGEPMGRVMLAYGITTARDPAGILYRSLEIREAIDSGVRLGPRMYASGPALDGTRGSTHEIPTIYSAAQLDMELERSRRLDFDLFKTYVRFPDALQKRVVDFAHRAGMAVTSHEVYPAVAFGFDHVEHTSGTSRRGYSPKLSSLGKTYNDIIQLIVKSGMTYTPTMALGGLDVVALDDPTWITDERLKLLPDWAIAPTRNRVTRAREGGAGQRGQTLPNEGRTLAAITRGGGRVLAGTDVPNMPYGAGLHAEIELYSRYGLTPFEALQTATFNAAEALGAAADLGTLQAGKLADLVIVNGDPLTDIKAARKVSTVIKNGQVLDMKTLLSPAGVISTQTGR